MKRFIFTPLLLLSCYSALAQDSQDFSLFEDVQAEQESNVERRVRREVGSSGNGAGPEFKLVGTSRIGNKHSAILEHRSGDTIRLAVDANGNTRIPGYSDFTIVHIGAGELNIRYPNETPCVQYVDSGVSCSEASNIARLSLALGEPVTRPEDDSESTRAESDGESNFGNAAGTEPAQSTNPFAALQNAANRSTTNPADNDAAAGRQPRTFQVRRIAPEDVPEGMRVVSTPFGDRLVEE